MDAVALPQWLSFQKGLVDGVKASSSQTNGKRKRWLQITDLSLSPANLSLESHVSALLPWSRFHNIEVVQFSHFSAYRGLHLTALFTIEQRPNNVTMKKIFTLLAACAASVSVYAQCSDIFISEYVEGSGNNKAIELYNASPNPIDLSVGQYKMGRDRNGNGTPMLLNITGIIQPYSVRVFVLDKRDANGTGQELPVDLDLQAAADTFLNPIYVETNSPMYFNGDDAFVLVKGAATILDIFGKIGEDPGTGWSVPGDPLTRWWSVDNTLVRKPEVNQGVSTNPAIFDPSLQWDSLPNNTYDSLGTHRCVCGTVNVNELSRLTAFDIFPNPVLEGQFALRGPKEMTQYTIYAGNGSVVDRKSLFLQTYQNISLPQAAPGVYVIEIIYADGSRSHKKLIFK
jgi:hypothetical protein